MYRIGPKRAIAASAATISFLVLSPAWAPTAAFADTSSSTSTWGSISQPTWSGASTVGNQVNFTVTPSLSAATQDKYEYRLYVRNSNDVPMSDLSLESPKSNDQSMTITRDGSGNTYASAAADPTKQSPVTFSLTALDAGSYQLEVELYDLTTNQPVGSPLQVPVTVGEAAPSPQLFLPMPNTYQTGEPVGSKIWLDQVDPNKSNVILHFQVTDSSDQPVENQSVQVGFVYASKPDQVNPVDLQDGVGVIGGTSGVSPSELSQVEFTFNEAGTYHIELTVLDPQTGKVLGVTSQSIQVGNPNVTADVTDAGTATTYVTVYPDGKPSTIYSIQANTSEPSTFLPPGKYFVSSVYVGSTQYTLKSPKSFEVTAEGGSIQLALSTDAVQDGTFSGTLRDSNGNPVANGYILVSPSGSSSAGADMQNQISISSDEKGHFSQQLAPGNYTVTGGGVPSSRWGNFVFDQPLSFTITSGQTMTQDVTFPQIGFQGLSDTAVGQQVWLTAMPGPGIQLPSQITAKISVQPPSGTNNIDLSQTWITFFNSQGIGQAYSVDSNGNVNGGTAISTADLTGWGIGFSFQNPGPYKITLSLYDASKPGSQPVASGSFTVTVHQPNVTGKLLAADGKTPVPYGSIVLTDGNGNYGQLQADSNGNISGYLPPGTWTVENIFVQGDAYAPGNQAQTFSVPSGGTVQETFTDPDVNVTGRAYEDAAKTTPLANGWVEIQPSTSQSEGKSTVWAPTSADGSFALVLQPGSYEVVQEADENVDISLKQKFEVSTGPMTLTVTPGSPDFKLSVEKGSKPAGGGKVWISVADSKGEANYSRVYQFSIASDGSVSGYLPAGSYVIYGIQQGSDWYPENLSLNIQDESAQVSQTIQLPSPQITGRLVDKYGNGVPYASIEVFATDDTNEQDPIWLYTDDEGQFTDLGWSNGEYTNLLRPNKQYTVKGVYTNHGWYELDTKLTTSDSWNLTLPGDDITGNVTIDGKPVSGWIGIATEDSNSDVNVQWFEVQSGTYTAYVPSGNYRVYGFVNSSGQFYSVNGQTVSVDAIAASPAKLDANISVNFRGKLNINGSPCANAWMELLPDNGGKPDWTANPVYISTDGNGNYAGYLDSNVSTWHLVAVGTGSSLMQMDYTVQPAQQQIDIRPNVTVTVSGLDSSVTEAWVVLDQTGQETGSTYVAQASCQDGSATFSLYAPDGSYQIMGVETVDAQGNYNWIPLNGADETVTVQNGNADPVSIDLARTNQTGQVLDASDQPVHGPGYVIFYNEKANGPDQYISVPFDSQGEFKAYMDLSHYTPIGVSTPEHYYSVAQDQYQYDPTSQSWTIHIQNAPTG